MPKTLDPLKADLSTLAVERLEAEITHFAGHIHAATCRWLLLVGEFDRREGWRSWGCRSTASWLSWQCGIDPMTACEQVRVGRALAGLPKIKQAFGRGELSYSKVRALSRVATPETEETLLMVARHATAAQLERLSRAYRTVRRREGLEEANDRHARRYARYHFDQDGSFVMSLRLSAEEGALVVKALEAARDEVRKAKGREKNVSAETLPEEGDDPAPTMADAVVAMAEAALPGQPSVRSGGDRYQVVVHVDLDSLVGDGGRSEIEDAAHVAPETARRIACDAGLLVAVHGSDGRLLTVGRRPDPSRPGSAVDFAIATAAVASPDAIFRSSSRPITSTTGPTEARPRWTTWSNCAGSITECFTRAVSRSKETTLVGLSFTRPRECRSRKFDG